MWLISISHNHILETLSSPINLTPPFFVRTDFFCVCHALSNLTNRSVTNGHFP